MTPLAVGNSEASATYRPGSSWVWWSGPTAELAEFDARAQSEAVALELRKVLPVSVLKGRRVVFVVPRQTDPQLQTV